MSKYKNMFNKGHPIYLEYLIKNITMISSMLNSFLKNKINLECEEIVRNFTLNANNGNKIYVEQISNDSVFVICTVNDLTLIDSDEDFCRHLLEENSDNERNIRPLYWSIGANNEVLSCEGLVVFSDISTYEEELYSLLCNLMEYKISSTNNNPPENETLADLSILINKI